MSAERNNYSNSCESEAIERERTRYLGPSKKSSFPRLWKYSGKRRGPHSTSLDWLRAKIKDDDIPKDLWRVHESLYNLEKFIPQHPGGSEWLSMTRGMDITELFENSHVRNVDRVEAILKQYYVAAAENPRNSPYTFHHDGFYKTLKRRIQPVFQEKGTNPTFEIKFLQDLMVAGFILFSILGVAKDSYLLMIVSGLFLGLSSAASHNFFHIKDNWRKFYFDLSLCSHYEWRIQHVFSHHGFPNTVLDGEVTGFQPKFEFLPSRKKTQAQRFSIKFYSHLVYFLTFGWSFYNRCHSIYNGKQAVRPENLIVIAQLLLFITSASSFQRGIAFWLVAHCVCSYWVVLTGLNAAHHHPVCFHDGDEARVQPDYGLCMLDATCVKIEDKDRHIAQIMTTYGEHNLHHLFPAVCASKIRLIKTIVEETVKEFEEDLIHLTQWQLFTGLNEQFARIKPKSLAEQRIEKSKFSRPPPPVWSRQ